MHTLVERLCLGCLHEIILFVCWVGTLLVQCFWGLYQDIALIHYVLLLLDSNQMPEKRHRMRTLDHRLYMYNDFLFQKLMMGKAKYFVLARNKFVISFTLCLYL